MKSLVVLAVLVATAVPASAATPRILAPLDLWPVWSPDGSHVAFTQVYANHMELFTLDVQTRRIVRVASGAGQLGPSWSHDRRRLVYSSGGVLHVVNADGSKKSRLDAPGRAYAPAWRPTGDEFAYLSTEGAKNLDLWEGGRLWARNAIGSPSWSPDGTLLAFQRDDGIYLASAPGVERQLVSVDNPGAPAWSNDGSRVAYIAHGSVFAVSATGGVPSLRVSHAPGTSRVPSWSMGDVRLSGDRAWSPVADRFVQVGARPGCPGHTVLLERGVAVTGSCAVVGTAGPDVIEGTLRENDVILAGAGNDRIHATDRHTDRVDCGAGRDTVWADRSDRLTACEVVYH